MTSIKDVARAAGVSTSTVSYALSGKRPVGVDLRRRIERAVSDLGYQPNAGARMLAGARSGILGLSAPMRPDMHAPSQMTFVSSVVKTAREQGYDVLLLTQGDAVDGIGRVVTSALIDGLVLMDVETDDSRVPVVRELDAPVTFIGVPRDHQDLDCVDLDFENAAALAIDSLADVGHRTIGIMGHPADAYQRGANFPPRFRDSAIARAFERGVRSEFQPCDATYRGSAQALQRLLARIPEMTGLVLHAPEPVAVGALEELGRQGLSVPEDISVVVAAGSFETAHLITPLTAIPLPARELGALATTHVLRALDGASHPPGLRLIPPHLVDYGSVSAPSA